MPDYQTLYFELFHAMEQAIRILIAAQQSCEEHYLAETEKKITPLPPKTRCSRRFLRTRRAACPHAAAGTRPLSRRGVDGDIDPYRVHKIRTA